MGSRTVVAIAVAVIVVALAVVFWLVPSIQEGRRPELLRAWVGIEAEGSGVAVVGRLELEPDRPFRLHAVLEAVTEEGEPVFYTGAPALRFDPAWGVEVPAGSIRTWRRPEEVRILWLTVEGSPPYVELSGDETLKRFSLAEFSHPEWGKSWVADGSIETRRDEQLDLGSGSGLGFGTQHYQVWVELFPDTKALISAERFKSPGPDELMAAPERFPAVVAALPGPLGPPTRVFGLTQVEPPPDAPADLLARLGELQGKGVTFTRLLLLRDTLQAAGTSATDLAWDFVDLTGGTAFGERVRPGDLLQVGARWVVLLRDRGIAGVLDPEDLCLDFDRGAAVRPLAAAFDVEEVEWAPLAAR
ncbi:MAG TPA: hypothetical protein VMV46_12230 [Thermoanaerobaculia bacterium]|nr:hypothetical protein [Thermoanaerobaculia bacterium]